MISKIGFENNSETIIGEASLVSFLVFSLALNGCSLQVVKIVVESHKGLVVKKINMATKKLSLL